MIRIPQFLVSISLLMFAAQAQVDMEREDLTDFKLGVPKVVDGSMDEWSHLGGIEGHGTADNEYYFYDSWKSFWKCPQGGEYDGPLGLLCVIPHPWYGVPMPVASGFNLWGAYLCYEPFLYGHSVSVALDLPCSSNMDVSPEYFHPYSGLPPQYNFFYPVAFDGDGNGNPDTVNNDDYYPGGQNGFNYIKSGGLVYDDRDQENYIVTLYFGDDDFPTLQSDAFSPGGTEGLIIQVRIASEFGVILQPTAKIPGAQTKTGQDLDLVVTYGSDVLQVGGHDNPDPQPGASPRIVDIEMKVSRLKTIVEDPTYIDWTKVGIGQISVSGLNTIYMTVKSGSLDDKSDEHLIQGGHVFPAYPFMRAR